MRVHTSWSCFLCVHECLRVCVLWLYMYACVDVHAHVYDVCICVRVLCVLCEYVYIYVRVFMCTHYVCEHVCVARVCL